jgi:beta-barrel assembly-enhancing protease
MSRRLLRELALVLAAVLALAALAFGGARLFFNRQVPNVNLEIERGLKPVMERQVALEGTVLKGPAATAAFASLLQRLGPGLGKLPIDPEIMVIDSPVVNAAALPGGIVCVYSGLARTLTTPEEMAAVLAHELAHVAARDSMTILARQIGMATLTAVITGGNETVAQSILRSAVNIRYTREAEDKADARALEALAVSGIDPGALGDALARMKEVKGRQPELFKYLDTHSDIDSRIGRARSASLAFKGPKRPLDVDWQAVQKALPSSFEAEKKTP